MKDFTRTLKEEAKKDIAKMHDHNNSKEAKRTPEQNQQAREDKQNFFRTKWEELLEQSETEAQKSTCEDVLSRIKNIR